jgi:hypothetical protein
MQHFPLSKEEATKNNYGWIEALRGEYEITIKASDVPESTYDTTENITKEVIECEKCKNPYRILPNEYIFLKREQLPIPRMCNECRHERRIGDRLSIQLYERSCMCGGGEDITGIYKNTVAHQHGNESCPEIFKTGYAPERPEIVYCEKCYQTEVY